MKCNDQIYTYFSDFLSTMFLSFLSCSLFSYAANPRAVIVKCDGCTYDVDVEVVTENESMHPNIEFTHQIKVCYYLKANKADCIEP